MQPALSIITEEAPHPCEWVVLVHGLFATPRSMRTLAQQLSAANYRIHNWSYPTFRNSVQQTARTMMSWLLKLDDNPECQSIHFVTHSLGAIVVRAALEQAMQCAGGLQKVKRVVMLAPPNRGSHLTRLSPRPLAWCVPAIADLTESPDSLPNRLQDPAHVEFGVIAAAHDMVVPISHTMHPHQRDHCILPTTHFGIPHHANVIRKVQMFLRTGRFLEPECLNTKQPPTTNVKRQSRAA